MRVQSRPKSKIISLNPGSVGVRSSDAHAREEPLRDRYMEGLTALSRQLCDMAQRFGEEPKQVLFDLTYVIVGNDIVETFRHWDKDMDET